jgi:hypothetical protein
MENPAYGIFVLSTGGFNNEEIIKWHSRKYNTHPDESHVIVSEITDSFSKIFEAKPREKITKESPKVQIPLKFRSVKSYRLFTHTINFHYGSKYIESILHPLFKHHEIIVAKYFQKLFPTTNWKPSWLFKFPSLRFVPRSNAKPDFR